MEIEVEGERYQFDWREAAILLALYWARFNALTLARLRAIEEDYTKVRSIIENLEQRGLVETVRLGRFAVAILTEKGKRVARAIEEEARKSGLLRKQN